MKSMLLEAEGEVLGLGTGCECYAAGLRVARGETDSSALHTQKSAEDRPGGAPGGCDLGEGAWLFSLPGPAVLRASELGSRLHPDQK